MGVFGWDSLLNSSRGSHPNLPPTFSCGVTAKASHSSERKMKHAEFWENEIRVRTTLVLPCSELQGHHHKITVNLEQYDVNDRYVDCGYLVG